MRSPGSHLPCISQQAALRLQRSDVNFSAEPLQAVLDSQPPARMRFRLESPRGEAPGSSEISYSVLVMNSQCTLTPMPCVPPSALDGSRRINIGQEAKIEAWV